MIEGVKTRAKKSEQCAGFFRVSHHTARRKRRTVCPHKELQSAFTPFIASERMGYKSFPTDKRKTALDGFRQAVEKVTDF